MNIYSLEIQDKNISEWIKLLYKQKTMKKWKNLSLLCPVKQIKIEPSNQIIELDYKPILRSKQLSKIMVLGTDVTAKIAMEAKLSMQQRESELKMERMHSFVSHDLELIREFLKESSTLVERYYQLESLDSLVDNIDAAYRDMHTLKGNAGSFNFINLAKIADSAEDFMSRVRDSKKNQENQADLSLEVWNERVELLLKEISSISSIRNTLFKGLEGKFSVDKEQYEALLSKLKSTQLSYDDILQAITDLGNVRFDSLMAKYTKLVRDYCQKSEKLISDPIILSADYLMDKKRFAMFDKAIIHLIRNAMDHGIEDPEQRNAANKGPGRIEVSCSRTEDKETIVIRDDGKGIDPDVIYTKALEKNLISVDKELTDQEGTGLDLLTHSNGH